jgi:hypothetical protein
MPEKIKNNPKQPIGCIKTTQNKRWVNQNNPNVNVTANSNVTWNSKVTTNDTVNKNINININKKKNLKNLCAFFSKKPQ